MCAAAFKPPSSATAGASAGGAPGPSLESVTTIRADGSRLFLHPADVHGRFTRARRLAALVLMAVYLLLPWIKIGGYPAVFLDVAGRRFHLFGLTLAAQDMWLMFFLISGLGFGLFFITAMLGRVWCGWACPQTVFLEHAFRRVERWLEGDGHRRRLLGAAPWSARKIFRRGLKHLCYLGFSAAIAHLFLSYFVSLPELWSMMLASPAAHWGAFVFMAAATGALYFNFAWFREQLCIVICPYGRLQSALIDDHSLVIGYDGRRGEPRGRAGAAGAGDCVDCARCVQVCPTGIDIRQGLQIECIGCAACIDACDEVMHRLHRPAGLVRYASQSGLAGRTTRWLRPRTLLYLVFLLAGCAAAAWAFSTVRPAVLGVTRMTGAPYFVDAPFVRDQFLVRIINKRPVPARFTLTVDSPVPVGQIGLTETLTVPALSEEERALVLRVDFSHYPGEFPLTVVLHGENDSFVLKRQIQFLGPDRDLLGEDAHEKGSGQ
jgi:cytochrome c oxidase accessory protein FixG